jgi:hypothetical protein
MGLFRSWSGLGVMLALAACSNIIGISSYEIDPALDSEGNGGSTSTGGSKTPIGDGGEPVMSSGGEGNAGKTSSGGKTGQGAEPGTAGALAMGAAPGMGGAPSLGGEPPVSGCQTALDCDDEIACTTDACNASGQCTHTPKNSACDASNCETCKAGIGCVSSGKMTLPLLLNAKFDDVSNLDWSNQSDRENIVKSAAAPSPPNLASFGPAPNNAADQEYGDLFQYVTIPEGLVDLALTVSYTVSPGTKAPADDAVWMALYEPGATKYTAIFHTWEANDGAKPTFGQPVVYHAPKADLPELDGQEFTFDIVASTWDTVFQFDSLDLTATVCQ